MLILRVVPSRKQKQAGVFLMKICLCIGDFFFLVCHFMKKHGPNADEGDKISSRQSH